MGAMASQITSLTIVLLNRLFGRKSKKTPKLRVTGLCAGNSPGAREFPAQRASNAENVSIRWRHNVFVYCIIITLLGMASRLIHFDTTDRTKVAMLRSVTASRGLMYWQTFWNELIVRWQIWMWFF